MIFAISSRLSIAAASSSRRARDSGAPGPLDTYPTIVNSTFTGNHSDVNGGAVGVYLGTLTIANSILWGNDAPLGTQIAVSQLSQPDPDLSIDYCDLQDGLDGIDNEAGANFLWGRHNIDADPVFDLQALTHPYRLRAASPCIDTGNRIEECFQSVRHFFETVAIDHGEIGRVTLLGTGHCRVGHGLLHVDPGTHRGDAIVREQHPGVQVVEIRIGVKTRPVLDHVTDRAEAGRGKRGQVGRGRFLHGPGGVDLIVEAHHGAAPSRPGRSGGLNGAGQVGGSVGTGLPGVAHGPGDNNRCLAVVQQFQRKHGFLDGVRALHDDVALGVNATHAVVGAPGVGDRVSAEGDDRAGGEEHVATDGGEAGQERAAEDAEVAPDDDVDGRESAAAGKGLHPSR